MRKGILLPVGGVGQEVDIQGLGLAERKNLIERLMRTAEEDNERFLLKLRDRMERYVRRPDELSTQSHRWRREKCFVLK
jgi:hypothetical protein